MKNSQQLPPNNKLAQGILDLALEIAAKRRRISANMKTALLSNDVPTVVHCARQLCGLDAPDQEVL